MPAIIIEAEQPDANNINELAKIALSLDFEKSRAYLWLIQNAHKYGFYLQYPKNNKSGIMFEPWHWYFKD